PAVSPTASSPPSSAAPEAQGQNVTPTAPDPAATETAAYNPGPLVPEQEHAIPVFARPEAELRAEFAARFGTTRPAGFGGDTPDTPTEDAGQRRATDTAADTSADTGQRPAAAAPVGPSSLEPTADDTPDAGVPAPDHEHAAAPAEGSTHPDDQRNDPAALARHGSGHPDSAFGALMQRMLDGGPADQPVNRGTLTSRNQAPGAAEQSSADQPGTPTTPSTSAPPSAASTPSASSAPSPSSAPSAEVSPSNASSRPDPSTLSSARTAAVEAAREAARGRGPARPPERAQQSASSVDWEDEVASDDDVKLEESGLVGRTVVERVLGARLLNEQPRH
ncbi:MAG: DNA polymerase III subunit gamma and tau, partial [Micrococcus sp.]|nr:DNA polymerase III subunit gamma and tau [Micrococcus sp.]